MITAGVPLGVSGTTNLLNVHIVGDVLVKGHGVTSGTVTAPVCVAQSEEDALARFEAGHILVISKTSSKLVHIMKTAAGIITEDESVDSHAAIVGMTLDIPVIVGAENATGILRGGTAVTMDADKGLVCN